MKKYVAFAVFALTGCASAPRPDAAQCGQLKVELATAASAYAAAVVQQQQIPSDTNRIAEAQAGRAAAEARAKMSAAGCTW